MKKRIAILLGLFVLPAYSQTAEPTVNTEIVTIALDEPVSGLFFHNGNELSIFQANVTGLGEPLKYKGSQSLAVRTSEAEFSLKPPLPLPYASVVLPLDSDRVLLACLKSGEAAPKIIAYDIAKTRIGVGDYRFFNFSRSVISVIFGEKKFAVKPGTDTLVSDSAWKKDVMEIDMVMAIVKDNSVKPVYSSQWGHRPGRRNYIFMFDGAHEYKPIKICRFFDVPSAEEQKPKR